MKRMTMLAAASLMVLAGQAQAQMGKLLVVAGGGGGGAATGGGGNGQFGSSGSAGTGTGGGTGGTMGLGGGAGRGGGGAGIFGNGGDASSVRGGMSAPSFVGGAGTGGYGGGGAGAAAGTGGGGGGGYSGGGGGANEGGGGGGGSFLDSSLIAFGSPTTNPGTSEFGRSGTDGFITISFLSPGTMMTSQTFGFTGAAQSYTFANAGLYSIVAAGGQGGNDASMGGMGALIGGQGMFTAGSTLSLIIGGGGGFADTGGGGGGSFVYQTFEAPATGAVPEPATWAMMILGFAMVGGAMRQRRRAIAPQVTYAA